MESSLQLKLIFELFEECVFGLDSNGRFIFINTAALELLGYQERELIGLNSKVIGYYSCSKSRSCCLTHCPDHKILNIGVISHGKGYFVRNHGRGIGVEYSSTPIVENNKIIGSVVLFKKVDCLTVVDKSTIQKEETNGEQFLVWEMIGCLNNHFQCILGNIEIMLLEDEYDSETITLLNNIKNTTREAASLVKMLRS
ncbi:MAG: PAS domain S-box protein [bacterium]